MLRALLLLCLALASFGAGAEVRISPIFGTKPATVNTAVEGGKAVQFPLGKFNPGDVLRVQVDVTDAANRNISAWILDAANYQAMQAGQNFQGVGRAKATTPTELPFNVKDAGSYYLLLDNRYALVGSKNVRIQTQTFRRLDPGKGNVLYSRLLNGYQMLRQQFDFPDFDIEVKPCGMVNALSTRANGDITLCSEMLDASEDKPGLFTGILLHEIGHSLLNLWGLPGSANEDTADEFAAQYILRMSNGPDLLKEYAAFFAGFDPYLEARNIIQNGDTYSLGIQRARNLTAMAANQADLIRRWNRLLYPHLTTAYLRNIVAGKAQREDRTLAAEELKRRGL